MAKATHTLHRQLLELNVPSQEVAVPVRARARAAVDAVVVPALERVFGRYEGGEHVWIERLVLDLGRLPVDRLETSLGPRIEKAFEQALATELDYLRRHPGDSTRGSVLTRTERCLRWLRTFLVMGSVPWSSPTALRSEAEGRATLDAEEVVSVLLHEAPDELAMVIREYAAPATRERLVAQLSPGLRQQLLAETNRSKPGDRGSVDGNQIADLEIESLVESHGRLPTRPVDLLSAEEERPSSLPWEAERVPERSPGEAEEAAGERSIRTARSVKGETPRQAPGDPPTWSNPVVASSARIRPMEESQRTRDHRAESGSAAEVEARRATRPNKQGLPQLEPGHPLEPPRPRAQAEAGTRSTGALQASPIPSAEGAAASEPGAGGSDSTEPFRVNEIGGIAERHPLNGEAPIHPRAPIPASGRSDSRALEGQLDAKASQPPEASTEPPEASTGPPEASTGPPEASTGPPEASTKLPRALPDEPAVVTRADSAGTVDSGSTSSFDPHLVIVSMGERGTPPIHGRPRPESPLGYEEGGRSPEADWVSVEERNINPFDPRAPAEIRPPGPELAAALGEGLLVTDAGLVLIAPYLPRFLRAVGLLEGRGFVGDSERQRAVLLLHYLATGRTDLPEPRLVLDKMLCGWPLDQSLARHLEPTAEEIEESERLLAAVLRHWRALGRTTIAGLRSAFLERPGRLRRLPAGLEGLRLEVDRTGYDVLIDRMPWSISPAALPWMNEPIFVEW